MLLCPHAPRLDQQRRQPAAFCTTRCPVPWRARQAATWLQLVVIGSLLPPSQRAPTRTVVGSFIEMLATWGPAISLPCCCCFKCAAATTVPQPISGLRTACMAQGPYAPIQHDRCFENWRSTDKTLVDLRVKHGRAGSRQQGNPPANLGNTAPRAPAQHRVLCVLGARGGDETKSVRTAPHTNDSAACRHTTPFPACFYTRLTVVRPPEPGILLRIGCPAYQTRKSARQPTLNKDLQ